MNKWKLMVTTLPVVGAFVGLKLGLEYGLGVHGSVDFADVAIILAAGIFLLGFMLNGTMADYKEAERLPGELACQLEALEDSVLLGARVRNIDPQPLRGQLLAATDAIHAWLLKKQTQAEVFARLHALVAPTQSIEVGPHATRALQELNTLRKAITRVAVISRTGFLPSGYALLEGLMVGTHAILLAARYKTTTALVAVIFFTSLVYVYMYRLIRDIDDPFEYGPDGAVGGAEIDLFPLTEYRERLAARVADEARVSRTTAA